MPVSGLDAHRKSKDSVSAKVGIVWRKAGEGPRLLVSIRSVNESNRAIAGGAEILDIKEPGRGSLGMATIEEIVAIANLRPTLSESIPLSVALGELVDWTSASEFPILPAGITFVKLGLSRCASNRTWRTDWQRTRAEFERRSSSTLNWVAVAYGDSTEAGSPPVAEVVAAAMESGCSGLLVDTWTKDGRTIFDGMDEESLTTIAADCHAAGLFFAVAGNVRGETLSSLAAVPVDVVAIRSAACVGTDRTAELDACRIADFRKAMSRCFDQSVRPIRHHNPQAISVVSVPELFDTDDLATLD